MCNALWYIPKKYRKNPNVYGLNQLNETPYCRHRPVLLLHGAVDAWSYLGDLAAVLKTTNIPAFVINLGFGLPTEETPLYSAFTQDCSYIDRESNLKFRSTPEANPLIGKVIAIALPSNLTETNWMREINKLDDLFNVNAKYDAIMDHKKCALAEELPWSVEYIDAGHIGIVFNRSTYSQVLQFLLK
ncbi:unnamed protein product [Rotaria socialis]|uniref:Uncharacterized protein n=1 Tax=Rotaria socialis TaxID=392032 RepID=A0A818CUG5_9BILA|nr:unnamed protein product [Rotaria socialis]